MTLKKLLQKLFLHHNAQLAKENHLFKFSTTCVIPIRSKNDQVLKVKAVNNQEPWLGVWNVEGAKFLQLKYKPRTLDQIEILVNIQGFTEDQIATVAIFEGEEAAAFGIKRFSGGGAFAIACNFIYQPKDLRELCFKLRIGGGKLPVYLDDWRVEIGRDESCNQK